MGPNAYYHQGKLPSEPRVRKPGRNALYAAAEHGRLNRVAFLLALGKNPDRQDSYGITPLQIAAWNNHCKIVAKLAKFRGSDLNLSDRLGHTALFKSVWKGCEVCVRCLLREGARVECQDHSANTPLMLACELGFSDIVSLLLNHGALTEARNRWGESALYVAAAHGNVVCARVLLQSGAHVDTRTLDTSTPLFVAAGRRPSPRTKALIKLLLRHNASPAITGRDHDVNNGKPITPFQLTCHVGNFDMARLLLQVSCDINPIIRWRLTKSAPYAFSTDPQQWEYFKEMAKAPPRLSDLCRVTIRDDLVKDMRLDLTKLGLPASIMAFIQMKSSLM